jgi:hypothetical protein
MIDNQVALWNNAERGELSFGSHVLSIPALDIFFDLLHVIIIEVVDQSIDRQLLKV